MATLSSSSNSNPTNNNCSGSWSSETNWSIAGGSLGTSITFESSSDSPIGSETVDATGKPNLILKPPSPDCGPCEITVSFTQKHELRQVYVRSTARVYEIYFAPSPQSSNEYLCTVRCGIATRDDDVLHATDAEEPVAADSNGSDGEQAKEKCRNDGTFSPNLDDWIEVKVPDSAFQDSRHSSLPEKIDANPGASIQDFYEATAEIADVDACASLTIRLLSLQRKDCLYVDEIYVFADPVESADSETPASQVANSTGSSLMAMLVPTLLQLSRTGNNYRQDKHNSDTSEKGVTDSINIGREIQHEESRAFLQDRKLQEANEATPEQPKIQNLKEVSDIEETNHFVAKNDTPFDRIQGTLELLVSRVSRIEDILLTFEENMLKPICSMETRLQRVEQQVEMLTKNSQSSGLPSGTRITAPEFSCNGSNSSSFYNEGDGYAVCGTIELEKKDTASDKCSNPPDDVSISVDGTRFRPSLVVTAPEFSYGDDEENSDAMELPEEIPKQALSIDDALAAALAGFLSTTGVQASYYSRTLTVQTPEFTIEGNGSDGKVVSPSARSDKPIAHTTLSCESNGELCVNDSVSNSSHTSSVLFMEQVMGDFDEISGIDGQDPMDEGGTSCSSLGTCVNFPTAEIGLEFGQTDFYQNVESTSVCERSEISKHDDHQTESGALHEGAENVVEGSEKDTFHDVFKSSSAATLVVDFELPILDVKFDSGETFSTRSSLEALLTDMPEFDCQIPPVQQREDEFLIGEQSSLIIVENGKPNSPLSGHLLFVDCDSYDERDACSVMEAEAPQYSSYTSNNQEMYGSLI